MGKNRKKIKRKGIDPNFHDAKIEEIARRLSLKYGSRKKFLFTNLEYHSNGVKGEIDVLVYDFDRRIFHFYEIKSADDDALYSRALEQYRRFCKTHPECTVKGIFVSPKRIERMPTYKKK